MAQTTSALWNTLWRQRGTHTEYKFIIDGIEYGADKEIEHSVQSAIFSELSIGNAASATLNLTLYADNIPRGAQITRYVRLVNGGTASEWLMKGVFFTNRRSKDGDKWTIEAIDAMRKADKVWEPDQSLSFPMPMTTAGAALAAAMGVQLDARSVLNAGYSISYPTDDMTIRDVLRYIAAAHGGNWIMSDEGKLLLIGLNSTPPETWYLVEQYGDAITFGGDRILVG